MKLTQYTKTERILFLIAATFLSVFSYLLYDDSLIFSRTLSDLSQKIGEVLSIQNDVRVKSANSFAWMPISSNTAVGEKDSIYTGINSTATIKLSDGSVLKIEPESLISLKSNTNGELRLDLKYGDIQAEIFENSQISVQTGSEVTQLKNNTATTKSQVRIKKAYEGINVNLEKGLAAITAKGKTKELKTQENVQVSPVASEIKKIEKPTITITSENGKNWLKPDPKTPVPVSWQVQGPYSGFEVELARDAQFSELLLTQKTQQLAYRFDNTDSEGTYYWRLRAYDTAGNLAETSKVQSFSIQLFTPPTIIEPKNGSNLAFEVKVEKNQIAKTAIGLKIQAKEQLNKIQVQVSDSADFTQIVQAREFTSLSDLQTLPLPAGSYFLRTRGFSDHLNVTTEWSLPTAINLALTVKEDPRPEAPILANKNIQFIPNSKLRDDRNLASIPQPPGPKLIWTSPTPVNKFIVQLSKDKSFDSPQEFVTTTSSWVQSDYQKGKTYFRVFAVGNDDLKSRPSEIGSIEVGFLAPTLLPVADLVLKRRYLKDTPPPQEINLQWTDVPKSNGYLLESSDTPEFKTTRSQIVTGNQLTATLEKPGMYFFRVKALSEDQKELTNFSDVMKTEYIWKTPLSTPYLMEPFDRASLFLQKETNPFIWLEWKKVEGAKQYQLEISSTPEFNKIILSTAINSNRYLIKEKIPVGKLYWRVRAIADRKSEDSEWAKTRQFEIYSQKNETFIK